MKLKELLEELPAPNEFKVVGNEKDRFTVDFFVGNNKYTFMAVKNKQAKKSWEVGFHMRKGGARLTGKTGTGNVGKVFATVLSIMKDFAKKKKPKDIGFFALGGGVRAKIYDRIFKNGIPGYAGNRNDNTFILRRTK